MPCPAPSRSQHTAGRGVIGSYVYLWDHVAIAASHSFHVKGSSSGSCVNPLPNPRIVFGSEEMK
jgi:hypothetical protein